MISEKVRANLHCSFWSSVDVECGLHRCGGVGYVGSLGGKMEMQNAIWCNPYIQMAYWSSSDPIWPASSSLNFWCF